MVDFGLSYDVSLFQKNIQCFIKPNGGQKNESTND